MPVVPDVPVPVPTAPPVVDGLELMPVPAEPPAAEPALEPPPLCAKTTVLDSANAVAKAIVVSFIGCFLSLAVSPNNSRPAPNVPSRFAAATI